MSFRRSTWLCLLVPVLSACGASDDQGPSESELRTLDEEAESIRQRLGEASCASTSADVSLDFASGATVLDAQSADGSYDHATCRNTFIVDMANVEAQKRISGGTVLKDWPDSFSCLFNWAYVGLYRKEAAGYVRVAERVGFPGFYYTGRGGPACTASTEVVAPSAGDYKIVVAAGAFFGATHPVVLRAY